MFYSMLLKVTWDYFGVAKKFQLFLQHVTEGWKRFRNLGANYELVKKFQHVTNNYIRFRNMETKYKVVKNVQIFSLGKLISSHKKL